MEAWDFIVAGGALYNNLDYSFVAGHEDGTFAYPASQPGGGNPAFRKQMRILHDFIHGFDFLKMRPDNSIFPQGAPSGYTARALVNPGSAYAIYLRPPFGSSPKPGAPVLEIDLPGGEYHAEWIDPIGGGVARTEVVRHPGGRRQLQAPPVREDIALRIRSL
jgi:hypothetical protein